MAHGQGGAEIGFNRGPTLTCNHEAPIVAHSLRGEGFDAGKDGTGRGTPLVPVAVGADCFNGSLTGDVAATLGTRGSSQNASGPTLLTASSQMRCVNNQTPHAVAHSQRGEGFDASEDGTGRGTPLVPVGVFQDSEFGVQQYDSAGTLRAGRIPEHQMVMQPVAFHPTQDPISSTDGTTHAMGCGSKGGTATVAVMQPVAFQPGNLTRGAGSPPSSEVFPTLKSDHGRGASDQQPHVMQPVHYRKSRRAQSTDDHETWVEDETTNTLNCFDVGDVRAVDVVAQPVAMINMQGSKGNAVAQEDGPSFTLNAMHGHDVHAIVAPTITATNDPSRSPQSSEITQQVAAVHYAAMQVRRLTPRECERLQGFPDQYTAIPWRGKPASECPDGPRYKALGNSWAVPVVRWIGWRIAAQVYGGIA